MCGCERYSLVPGTREAFESGGFSISPKRNGTDEFPIAQIWV